MSDDKRKKAEQISRTVFAKIPQTQEVIARLLVFPDCRYKRRIKFHSEIVDGEFDSREEAIAATVKKLKEVEE